MAENDYELLDFGEGRTLERFGCVLLDRPCPAADRVAKARPQLWCEATSRYERTRGDEGEWAPAFSGNEEWTVKFALNEPKSRDATHRRQPPPQSLAFRLQPSPFGHVDVFPEQAENWGWIAHRVAKAQSTFGQPPKVLNLFAYTGGSTMAAAAAGAEVVHIDAARNIVERARENAALSGLAERHIRWIVEDAAKFCRRELKRGNRYDAVILDPPTYGHGPKGEAWKIAEHLLPLLQVCGELTADHRAFIIITCHTPGIGPAELAAYMSEGVFGNCGQPPASGELFLRTSDGRKLLSGFYARWPAGN